ncbi:kinase domain protein [Aspergillus coremiiformis]|uniref:non-specific serine/threonine protein kinase n=1 Tax=Aspergillus coremiiformis TaxID=138285 RepID=A0A5N6ZBB6_9EURO|nr:kinase domain protein [Aspergillus coremiiformis]
MSVYRPSLVHLARGFSSISKMSSVSQTVPFSSIIIEEDRHPDYDPRKYYPARIGEAISKQYRLVAKLGWGANSTVWLAKDITRWAWQSKRYVTLKITNSGKNEQMSAQEEVAISQHISRQSDHKGQAYIRLVKESFQIRGPFGEHMCLVFEPLREPLWLFGRHLGHHGVPSAVLKPVLKLLLQGLDFLHSECHIIHTDLKSDNFLVGFEDPAVLESYVRQQERDPAPYKLDDNHFIFQSRQDFGPLRKGLGTVKISDFSAAVFGNVSTPHNHDIQPRPFCAPEVLLRAPWSYGVDIWNLGTALWELLADTTLFNGQDPRTNEYSREAHLAQMIRLLGPPPSQLLEKVNTTVFSELFSVQGEFKFPHLIPSEEFNLDRLTPFLHGEDKRLFLEFAKRMLQWDPEQRSTAKDLSNDPWLTYKP